jgi:hypothetical protein
MYQYHHERPTSNLYFDAARGNLYDTRALNLFGFNRLVGTAYETLWDYGGVLPLPASANTLTVVSSASDAMSLLINGLDSDYNEITEVVTLTGTTPVSTSSSFFRVNSAVILSGSNTGNISISSGASVVGYITAGLGATQSCAFTVPAGHSLYLLRIDCNSSTVNPNKYLYIRNSVRSSTGRTLKVAEATFATSQVSYDRQIPFKIDEKSDFSFESKSSSGENEVAIFVEALLCRDDY